MDEPLRDFADRFFRDALRDPENLAEFLMNAVPELAPNFDFTRTHLLKPDFLLPSWRRREADLLFEIPYRFDEGERLALVCVLIEHQTRPDPRMPLRTLLEVALYWDQQSQTWENTPQPKDEFRLTPVLPIVLHAGEKPWGSARSIAAMLDPPAAFHPFAPVWQPVFWELSKHSPDELLNADSAFLQVLAAVRMENEELGPIPALLSRGLCKVRIDSGDPSRSLDPDDTIDLRLGLQPTAPSRTADVDRPWRRRSKRRNSPRGVESHGTGDGQDDD